MFIILKIYRIIILISKQQNVIFLKGYEVRFDGVGYPSNGDLSKGPCSQIAIFTRIFKKNLQNIMKYSPSSTTVNQPEINMKLVAEITFPRSKHLITDEV
jgi:hypothetical protein